MDTTHYEPESRVSLTPKFLRENTGVKWCPKGKYLGITPGGFARVLWDDGETMIVAFEHLMREVT